MKKTGFLLYPASVFATLVMVNCSSWLGLKSDDSDSAAMNQADPSPALRFQASGPQDSDAQPGRGTQMASSATGAPRDPKKWPAKRVTREDFIDKSQEEGSLWASGGQTNYYFTKNRIRSPGDIVALTIEDELFRQIGNEIKQTFSVREQAQEVALLQDEIKQKLLVQSGAVNRDILVSSSAAPQPASERTPAAAASPGTEAAAPAATPANSANLGVSGGPPLTPSEAEKLAQKYGFPEVDVFPLIALKSGEKFMGEIVQRFPNGNYLVRATKRVTYKRGESRNVTVLGIVKAVEINEETDLIASGKLYETQIDISR